MDDRMVKLKNSFSRIIVFKI